MMRVREMTRCLFYRTSVVIKWNSGSQERPPRGGGGGGRARHSRRSSESTEDAQEVCVLTVFLIKSAGASAVLAADVIHCEFSPRQLLLDELGLGTYRYQG